MGRYVMASAGAIAMCLGSAFGSQRVEAQGLAVDVEGTLTSAGQLVGTFVGSVENISFKRQGREIVAVGQLTGDLLNSAGQVIDSISQRVKLPILDIGTAEPEPGNCQVLFLELGPIELELLGLELFIDEIVIDLEANPAGGILGQLLCALAGGLNLDLGGLIDDLLGGLLGRSIIDQIVDILNDVL